MNTRVPVFSGERILELAGPERVKRLAKATNVEVIRRRKDRKVVQINLVDHGTDKPLAFPRGNPLKYSSLRKSEAIPRGVWCLKRLPSETAEIFDEVVRGCLAKAA